MELLCGGDGPVLVYFDDFDVEFGEDALTYFEVGVVVGQGDGGLEVAGVASVDGNDLEDLHEIVDHALVHWRLHI